MVKYRLLTNEELSSMKKEFIDYLVINGITADEWKKILETDVEKAKKITHLFSDVVFEKILRKVDFVIQQNPKSILAFNCQPEVIEMVGLIAEGDIDIDFTDPNCISKLIENPVAGLETVYSKKEYGKPRELEIFELTQRGGMISDGKVFQTLKSIV